MGQILAIDQGTTGTTCLVVDPHLAVRGRGYAEVPQYFPRPGWVEQEPEELWDSVLAAAAEALADAGIEARDLTAIGIANQRETTIVWERRTGRAVHRAIVWQDRRTAERCRELPRDLLRDRTGLVPDPYFSATKLEWLLSEREPAGLAFGTVDSWLVWKLTGGAVHVTDVSNAARTLLFDLRRLEWDDELLELFGVPREVLPAIVPSAGRLVEADFFGARVPVCGIAGDQQAALFGQACFRTGQAKATFGTGSFVLVNIGEDPGNPREGLVQTIAWRLGPEERPVYALEGSIFVTGAAIQWLRDGLGLLASAAESEAAARSLEGNDGVYFVPALAGLGSPHWQPEARGLIAGLTQSTRREHLVRAALEAMAYQVADVLDAVGVRLEGLRADGGAAANRFVMQLLADVARIPVEVPRERETTALGAAALAGLGAGVWAGMEELSADWRPADRYEPELAEEEAKRLLTEWRRAVRAALR
ncbi:MAG: glycerol kinase GlpK [Actinobacteria bacterium]|nr:MAG: glycerol kinase GlpK [Actinomycetota bacterium]